VTGVSIITIACYWFALLYGYTDRPYGCTDRAEIDAHDQKPCKPEKPAARKDSSGLFDGELDS
jgi:hypothetical protein